MRLASMLLPPLLLLPAAARAQEPGGPQTMRYGFSFHQRIVIRLPRLPAPPPPRPVEWREARGPKCLAVDRLAGAALTRADSIDFVQLDGRRFRARFDEDCPAFDFYDGLYVRQPADGQLCARRDVVRSRSGGACRIDSFRRLTPR